MPLDPTYLATQEHNERGSLLPTHRAESAKWATPEQFNAALDREREKVATFYNTKLAELLASEDLIEDEVHSIELRELSGDDELIREEDEDLDDDADEGDALMHAPSPGRHLHKRGSVFGRLPSMPRIGRAKVSTDQADIIESTFPGPVRRGSRQRSRSVVYPSTTEDEGGTSTGGPPSPVRARVPQHRRALSDLSSADDPHFDRRTSFSSMSSGGGWGRGGRRTQKLGLQAIEPSNYPEWLQDEVHRDEEAGDLDDTVYYNWTGNSDYATVLRIGFKKRISALWLDFYALKQYVDLNMTAFEKILKKYDKNTNSKLKKQYITDKVLTTLPWTADAKEQLDLMLSKTLFVYRRVVVAGDEELAKEQLRAQLRERIVIDRETVWSQMVSDRRGQGIFRSVEPDEQLPAFAAPKPGFRTPCGRLVFPKWISRRALIFLIAVGALVALCQKQPFDRVEESNCMAMLVFCTILWASEAIPLFVTSLIVPFLVVVLRVLRSDDEEDRRLTAAEATKFIFSQMFSPTIMLLIGGFTIAAGLSRTRIDHMTASRILNAAGSNPSTVLLVLMSVATFASMWISNVAAPTLCYALVRPILDELPPKSVFSKCLIVS